MNLHDLRYCAFLMARVKKLYVEREAMTTILDSAIAQQKTVSAEWRAASQKLCADPVFQSSVEANFAPVFERMRSAMTSDTVLAHLTGTPLLRETDS